MAVGWLLQRTTVLDRIIILVLAVGTAWILWRQGFAPAGESVIVEAGGTIVYTAPLERDERIPIAGPLGTTELVIQGGHAFIAGSPCPLKVCLGMGAVSRSGGLLACVPNGVLVRIEGERGAEGNDLISY